MKFTIVSQEQGQKLGDYELRFVMKDKIEGMPDQEALALAGFKDGSVQDLPSVKRVYVSIKDMSPESLRVGISKAVGALKDHKIETLRLPHLKASFRDDIEGALTAIAEGFVLSNYSFDKYKKEKKTRNLREVFVSVSGTDQPTAMRALEKGKLLAEATNYVRDIGNEFPQVYTSVDMTADAESLALKYTNVSCEHFGRDYLKKQGMNAFLAVNQSSPYGPALIHLTYKPREESKGKICFVGKGLTYDSGGISLKSNPYNMKSDKCGAAAALGIIKAAVDLDLPYEIHSVLGVTENMVGANAYKPDDILIAKNGVSIEVNNTDAEGRLVLADCLVWAQEEIKPDMIIDMATLTGACVVGLGGYTTGVMGNNYDLQVEFKKKAQESGELYTVLEFNDPLRKLIESKVADVRNSVPGGTGGAITAALFLDRFIKDEYKDKWLHLDIAGPAFDNDGWGYNPPGATGAAVRGCIYYLMAK